MKHNCLITSDDTVNFRDVGDYENNKGKYIKWRKTYRSNLLSSLTEHDEEKLEKMNVTVDCNLRTSNEQVMAPDRKWPGVEILDYHVYTEDSNSNLVNDSHRLYRFLHHIPKADGHLGEIYQSIILSPASQKTFARMFAALLALPENETLVYHRSAEKDHAGMTTALILKGLGIGEHTIARDYLLTSELHTFELKKQLPNDSEMIKMVNQMNITEDGGTAVKGVTQTIDAEYGGFENYFTEGLGFSKQDLRDFRKLYSE